MKEYSKKELKNLNQQLIALEKSFISDQGMYFGSWYKSLYASSDPFSGYAAWILPGLEYEIALKSSDRLQEWDSRYTNAINSLTLKMRSINSRFKIISLYNLYEKALDLIFSFFSFDSCNSKKRKITKYLFNNT